MYILKIKGKAKIPDYIQIRDDDFTLKAYFRVDRPEKSLEKIGLGDRREVGAPRRPAPERPLALQRAVRGAPAPRERRSTRPHRHRDLKPVHDAPAVRRYPMDRRRARITPGSRRP